MIAFVRLVILGYAALSVVYFLVSLYSRSVRKEKLEDRWDEANPGGDRSLRDAYVEGGLAEYRSSFRRKLIVLVYIIPTIAVAAIMIIVNAI